MNKIVFGIK